MRTKLHALKLVIINKVSNLKLAYFHLRLEEIFSGSEWFGIINIVFVGDILQLQYLQ